MLKFVGQQWLLAVLVVLALAQLAVVGQVEGPSMLPGLQDGDRVLVCKWQSPRRDDLVFLRHQRLRRQMVKRVFLEPGDVFEPEPARRSGIRVEIGRAGEGLWTVSAGAGKHLVRAGSLAKIFPTESIYLRSGEFFVLGDNRLESVDSRSLGAVRKIDVVGRVCLRFWKSREAGTGR